MKNNKKQKTKKNNVFEVVVNGIVEEAFPNAQFKVRLENDDLVFCTICGKIRKNNIRIILGDKVQVGLSIYDLNKGRILYRNK